MHMKKVTYDPGLTQKYTGPLRRVINEDGSFNVHRRGVKWQYMSPYLNLINMSWPRFLAFVFSYYITMNTIFALAYFLVGAKELQGADAPTAGGRFMNDFFFSAQTLSTVGYGFIAPRGLAGNTVAAFELLVGLMGFALVTGLLFGRFSKASAKIGFSPNMLVTKYQDITSLQCRIVNQRVNSLLELEATVLLMTVDEVDGELKRDFTALELERTSVVFFPLTWTIVHPITAQSPLFGKTKADFERMRAEFLVLVKGFDDTFSQTVHTRYSYRVDELKWGDRFAPAFRFDSAGDAVLDVDKVGSLISSS
jgi:inward rectifier potassium channel